MLVFATVVRYFEEVARLAEKLFALIMLGDDRSIVATYAMGRKVYSAHRHAV